ncbi:ogr/Delta-like zinc finger family protein [Burkholderia ubonensis]
MSRMTIDCPCCGAEIEARHTEGMSATMRRLFVCDACEYRTPAGLEIL